MSHDVASRSEEEQAAFFDAVHAAALDAQQARGTVQRTLDVAGTCIRLQFAGPTLCEALMPSLEHLRVDESVTADVTIHVWESTTTGVEMAPAPCPKDYFTDRGDIWGFSSDRYRTAFHWHEFSVNVFDRVSRTGVWWTQTARGLPYWTKASPLRTLLHWSMELYGQQLLHAAAVGTADGAVLLTGKGGVGKSTTALSALRAGWDYAGDDYVVVGLEPEPTVYCLYGTAKLNPDQAERFPEFAELVTNTEFVGEEKASLRLFPALAAQIQRKMRVRAVLSPRFAGGSETSFAPASPHQLFRSMSFTTMSQLPHAGAQTNDFIWDFLNAVPGFEVSLGSDLSAVVTSLATLLRSSDDELTRMGADTRTGVADAPLISVIIPVYNGARFLQDAIANILSQGYAALEIIVVDDGSTDDIEEVVTALPVDVRFFRQPNSGPASARNRGIRDASGELIAFLDVDDLWPVRNLETLVEALQQRPDIGVVHGYAQTLQFDEASSRYVQTGNPQESFPYHIGAALYRRSAFERVGLFDSDLVFGEDTDWFNRARELSIGVVRIPEVTLHVRRHGHNMTRGKSLVELNTLRVLKKVLDRKRGRSASTDGVGA